MAGSVKRPSFWLHLGFALAVSALAFTRAGRMAGLLPPPIEVDLAPGEAMQVEDAVVALKRFRVPRYESGKPRQFVSEVHYMAVGAKGSVENVGISVNHPLVRGGWWIYQSGWGEDARGEYTVLKCVRDPFLPLAFAGWAMMLLGAAMLAVKWWRSAVAEERRESPGGGSACGIGKWWPYAAAVAVSAVPVYFIGRSVLRPDLVPALQSPLLFPHILAYLLSYVIFLFAAFGLHELHMRRGAHDFKDFVGVLNVRNLNTDTVAARTGDIGLGITCRGQSVTHNRDSSIHLFIEVLRRGIAQIHGIDASAQVQAQADRPTDRLQDVLANLSTVDCEHANQHNQQKRDAKCYQTLRLHSQ